MLSQILTFYSLVSLVKHSARLELEEIEMFYAENYSYLCPKNLKESLDNLVEKGYLKLEHPRDEVAVEEKGKMIKKRVPREDLSKGYNSDSSSKKSGNS